MKDLVKAKIIELLGMECKVSGCKDIYNPCPHGELSLADVLRAIHSQLYFEGKPIRFSGSWVNELVNMWNLTVDYEKQTQEMKDLIGKLLNVTEGV